MRLTLWGALAAILLVAAACSGGGPPSPPPSPTTAPPPGDTATPVPSPTPRPTPLAGGYTIVEALPAARFERMVAFAVFPGSAGEALVATQGGEIWGVPLNGAEPALFGDISDRLTGNSHNEEGLLGLAISPDFQSDASVYLYYTTGSPQPAYLSRLRAVEGKLDTDSEERLLEVPQRFANHNGGQVLFGPDGYLYLGLGDGGAAGDTLETGQDPSDLLGSVLRIDVSGGAAYAVPPDNPLPGNPVYAYGLRNPWRFTFDRETGVLWLGDVGQSAWEEVDRVVAGGNYGWDVMEGFECFEPPSACDQSGLELPRAAYGHDEGCSVTGGYVYRGSGLPELDGWYVYADFCSGRVWAVDTAGEGDPVLLAETGRSIVSFGELPDGELLLLTFPDRVYRLSRR